MENTFIQLDNENSIDRTPDDSISPTVDASNNEFEKNPDDSVDITAPFDQAVSEEIETELSSTDNSGDTGGS